MRRALSVLGVALASGCALPHPALPSLDAAQEVALDAWDGATGLSLDSAPEVALDALLDEVPGSDVRDATVLADATDGADAPPEVAPPDVASDTRPDAPPEAGSACGPAEGSPCDTHLPGLCGAGEWRCSGPNAMCRQTVSPQLERCDGLDNNCNTLVDDGFACALGSAPAPCVTSCATMGTAACQADCSRAACVPPAESCNLRDDNCNTLCDEGCRVAVYQHHQTRAGSPLIDLLYALEDAVPGYTADGRALFLYPPTVAPPGTIPVYRCYNAAQRLHLLSLSTSCNGNSAYAVEAVLGHAVGGALCGASLVYAAYCSAQGSAYVTLSATVQSNLQAAGCMPYLPGFWAWGS